MRKAHYAKDFAHICILLFLLVCTFSLYDVIFTVNFNSTDFISKSAPLLQQKLNCIDIKDEKTYLTELENHNKLSSNIEEFENYISSIYIPTHLKKLSINLVNTLNDYNSLSLEYHNDELSKLNKQEISLNIKDTSIILEELRTTINNISKNIRDYLSSTDSEKSKF